jgi:protein-S-isoprenylcysteine O-methyltransferase Ste14
LRICNKLEAPSDDPRVDERTRRLIADMSLYGRLGEWAFRRRSWLPVPLALVLVFVRWREIDSAGVFLGGLALVVLGLAIRFWAVRHIGTISRTRANRQGPLVRTGPYAWVRNPLYVGNWLIWTGFALASELVWMVPVAWGVFAVQYGAIASWEEARLRGHYRAEYDAYARAVPRWIPWRPARGGAAPPAFIWREALFSERGTLLAAAIMTALLLVKASLR